MLFLVLLFKKQAYKSPTILQFCAILRWHLRLVHFTPLWDRVMTCEKWFSVLAFWSSKEKYMFRFFGYWLWFYSARLQFWICVFGL